MVISSSTLEVKLECGNIVREKMNLYYMEEIDIPFAIVETSMYIGLCTTVRSRTICHFSKCDTNKN